jgi:hypothetical protein
MAAAAAQHHAFLPFFTTHEPFASHTHPYSHTLAPSHLYRAAKRATTLHSTRCKHLAKRKTKKKKRMKKKKKKKKRMKRKKKKKNLG